MRSISKALCAVVGSLGLLGAGVGGASASAYDLEPPVILPGTASYRVGTTLSNSEVTAEIPVTLSWRQFDEDGICDRTNEYFYSSHQGHTYPDLAPGQLTYTTWQRASTSYLELGFRSMDCAGNAEDTYIGDSLNFEQQSALNYGAGWRTQSCACSSGGGSMASSRVGATATFNFTGNSVALISVYGPGRGSMAVYVDGTREKTVNLARSRTTNRVVTYQRQWGAYQRHQIKVVALTTAKVEIDAVLHN